MRRFSPVWTEELPLYRLRCVSLHTGHRVVSRPASKESTMHRNSITAILKTASLAALGASLLLLGGCADHPRVAENYSPGVPLTQISVLRESRGVLKVCLHAEAFALDDGKTALSKVADRALANCYPEVDTYARLNAGRTKTFHGQLLMFRSALEQAHRFAEESVRNERKDNSAP